MTREKCAHYHRPDWRCGNYPPKAGGAYCVAHDPDRLSREREARTRRKQQLVAATDPRVVARRALLSELAELRAWWDGPGSEGRCV